MPHPSKQCANEEDAEENAGSHKKGYNQPKGLAASEDAYAHRHNGAADDL